MALGESAWPGERMDGDIGDSGADDRATPDGATAFDGQPSADQPGETPGVDWILRGAAELAAEAPPRARVVDALNPKDAIGSDKLPLHLWPLTATALGSIALLNGALKYGRANWRASPVRASIYVDACQRHLAAWFEGEEDDEEGVPHLGSALACLAILADAGAAGTLHDDRQFPGGYRELADSLTPLVGLLRARHAAAEPPRHWSIGDSPDPRGKGS